MNAIFFFNNIQKDGTVIIAIDGNFGLVRRRKAGTSDNLPKAGFFLPDEDVRSFTEAYNDKLQHNKEVICLLKMVYLFKSLTLKVPITSKR